MHSIQTKFNQKKKKTKFQGGTNQRGRYTMNVKNSTMTLPLNPSKLPLLSPQ